MRKILNLGPADMRFFGGGGSYSPPPAPPQVIYVGDSGEPQLPPKSEEEIKKKRKALEKQIGLGQTMLTGLTDEEFLRQNVNLLGG